MPTSFANPAGFWVLLGVPVILLWHFLQRRRAPWPISTLFLVPVVAAESIRGSWWQRLRQTPLLWAQILVVLLLAWLVSEPRWLVPQAAQRRVVVLDSTASMQPWVGEIGAAIAPTLQAWEREAVATEWTLVESARDGRRLYYGASLAELLAALGNWRPASPVHDPGPAVRDALAMTKAPGSVLLVTDRRPNGAVAEIAAVIGVGRPLDNVGFLGPRVFREAGDGTRWRWEVIVRNASTTPQDRTWTATDETGRQTPPQPLRLAPGELRRLSGVFPSGQWRLTLQLSEDAFPLDDGAALLVPAVKPLRVGWVALPAHEGALRKLVGGLEATEDAQLGGRADLLIASILAGAPAPEGFPAVVLYTEPLTGTAQDAVGASAGGAGLDRTVAERIGLSSQPILVMAHGLTDGLSLEGLLVVPPSLPLTTMAGDEVLAWQGDLALLFLRKGQLWVNFDLSRSNAARHPAFLLLIGRFLESVRQGVLAAERRSFQLGEGVAIPAPLAAIPLTTTFTPVRSMAAATEAPAIFPLRAPTEPGFFELSDGRRLWLHGAAQLTDPRLGDFRDAESFSSGLAAGPASDVAATGHRGAVDRRFEARGTTTLLLGLLGAMLGTWHLASDRSRRRNAT